MEVGIYLATACDGSPPIVVVRRWNLSGFENVFRNLRTVMKSTFEIMTGVILTTENHG
jgi:carbamoylphosphate synthase large subunit